MAASSALGRIYGPSPAYQASVTVGARIFNYDPDQRFPLTYSIWPRADLPLVPYNRCRRVTVFSNRAGILFPIVYVYFWSDYIVFSLLTPGVM